jgi:hypothetical protein
MVRAGGEDGRKRSVHNRARDNQTSASFKKGQIGATAEVVWETSILPTLKQKEIEKKRTAGGKVNREKE